MSQSIYDLYNDFLVQDQPYVTQITTDIDSLIATAVSTNQPPYFDYVMTPVIGNLDIYSKNRIIDQVIFYYRSLGIRATIKNPQQNNEQTGELYSYTRTFNFMFADFTTITISWKVRNSTEFMKTYC